jgi:hypothetical protein
MDPMSSSSPWQDVGCVRIAIEDLRVLADLRGRVEVRVRVVGGWAWVSWEPGTEPMPEVLVRRLLPLPGVEMYTRRSGAWFRWGARLPAFEVPLGEGSEGTPLERIVLPKPMTALPPSGVAASPVSLRLVRDSRGRSRPASGLLCSLARLAEWAEDVTSERLAALQAAWSAGPEAGSEDRDVLVLGAPGTLPELPDGLRFWGVALLVPMGFRPDPDLPEPALRGAVGAGSDELVVLHGPDSERIPRAAFQPLSRAAIRLARSGMRDGQQTVGGRRP